MFSPFFPQLRVAKEAAAVPVAATQPSYNEWDQPLRTPSPQLAAPPQQSNAFADYGAEADGGFGFEDCKFLFSLGPVKVS